MLIDTQCHVFPENYAEMLANQSVFPKVKMIREEKKAVCEYNEGLRLMIDFQKYSLEGFLGQMEKNGITLSLISCNIPDPCTSLPKEMVAEACTMINDEIADWVRAYPDRFAGIASIPWNLPQEAVAEVIRAKKAGFKGVQLLTQNGGILADDPLLDDIYRECERQELPIFIHPTVPVWNQATAAYNLTTSVGFPMDTSLTAIRMVYGGVLDRYPGLRIHMPHAGGVLPWLDGRLSYRPPAVPKPKLLRGSAVDYFKSENFWYDICNPSTDLLRMFYTYIGADRCMFATDYPFLSPKDLFGFMEGVGYSEKEMEGIMWKNANRFYHLGLE